MPADASCPGVHDLRVEYLDAPRAIGTARPRFSWRVAHPQSAYRLVVRRGVRGDPVWDSGRIAAAHTHLIEYAGPDLASDADYTWSVRSWGGAESAEAASTFGTSLLRPRDYRAQWVEPVQVPAHVERWSLRDWIAGAGPQTPPEHRLRPVQLLRQRFELPAAPVRARLYATARGVYTAWLNGGRVGDEVLSPGFDAYAHRTSVQCFDVTAALHPGGNALAVALADGWWAGRIGITGSSAQWGDTTRAWWQLQLEFADGSRRTITSGDDVVSTPGPWRYADLFVGEHYDATAGHQHWREVDGGDGEWMPVTVHDHESGSLVPFTGEPVRRVAELAAVSRTAAGAAEVIDFGQVIAGRVRIRLTAPRRGQRIVIEHTELLAGDGTWFQNIAGINKEQTDVYIAAGDEVEEWEPEFTFHGFRYARVTGAGDALADITAVVLSSDLEQTGAFASSDPDLDRLHENVVWSQRANFLSVPTDCPQRERAGWTGDAQVFAPAATNNALVAPFLSRWLDNLRADQDADGAIPLYSPRSPFDVEAAATATGIGAIRTAAGWGDAIALVPWTLWERYGDRRVLEDNYAAIARWIAFQGTDAYLEGDHFGDWLTPSTLEGLPHHEAITVAPALTGRLCAEMFRAHTLAVTARIAGVLGRTDDAQRLSARARDAAQRFAAERIDAAGDLPVRLQGVYTLALAFDLVPADRRAATAARLAQMVRENGDRLDTGFLSVPHLLDVLWDTGHADLARRVLWQRDAPSWLAQVDRGATTIWETWDAVEPDRPPRPVSLNHYAFGCVDDVLYRRIAGIRPTAAGYASATIAPDIDAPLTSVRAQVTVPAGVLAVAWRRVDETVEITVDIPHGVTATLALAMGDEMLPPGIHHRRVMHVRRGHTPAARNIADASSRALGGD